MERSRFWLSIVLSALIIAGLNMANAQPGPMEPGEGRPGMGMGVDRPGPDEMMENRERMERMGKFPGHNNPEMEKVRKQRNAVSAIAEAHKELAKVYEEQKKIDEAAAELKKILALFEENSAVGKEGPDEKPFMIMKKVIPIYHEIGRLYLMNNRLDDAEKIMLEGVAKFEKDEPQAASKLILALSDMYRKNNKLDKAEEMLKKVIEINQKALKEK
ncbi:MAG: tetratricopeptide repeat protein [Candidatus Rifleibacteriota bacterium]